jgi:hypothetical protein
MITVKYLLFVMYLRHEINVVTNITVNFKHPLTLLYYYYLTDIYFTYVEMPLNTHIHNWIVMNCIEALQ